MAPKTGRSNKRVKGVPSIASEDARLRDEIDAHREAMAELRLERARLVKEARDKGMPVTAIAEVMRVNTDRVYKLLREAETAANERTVAEWNEE